MESDLPMASMRQRVQDIYANGFEPAYSALSGGINGNAANKRMHPTALRAGKSAAQKEVCHEHASCTSQ